MWNGTCFPQLMPLQRLKAEPDGRLAQLDASLRPITTEAEVDAFLKALPVVIDRKRFLEFVLGFPRRYLEATAAVEVLRHYTLMASLGKRPVISALARDGQGWHLCVIARDRRFLFCRIAGSLSSFGLNILRAEAFANASALVLDTFEFEDPEGRFDSPPNPREFQVFLERVLSDLTPLEDALPTGPDMLGGLREPLTAVWDDLAYDGATLLRVSGPDQFGFLYRLSYTLAVAGCNIEMAYLSTPGGEIQDRFYLTLEGRKLNVGEQRRLTADLGLMLSDSGLALSASALE
jgi:[protein-PII] uridylyltransferase